MSKTTVARSEMGEKKFAYEDALAWNENITFPESFKKIGLREEDHVPVRLENGNIAWKPKTTKTRQEVLKELNEIMANAPKSELDDLTDEQIMELAIEDIRISREARDKELAEKKSK